jgi:hypothetical protein
VSGFVDRDGAVRDSILDTLPDAEALLEQRREIVAELAPLRALYGGQGFMGERQFKLEEAKVDTAVRTRFKAAGVKATEGMVDADVRQSPDYITALAAEIQRKAEWVRLEEALNEVEWRLRLRTSDSYLLGAEAKLT